MCLGNMWTMDFVDGKLTIDTEAITKVVEESRIQGISLKAKDGNAFYGSNAFIFDLTSVCFKLFTQCNDAYCLQREFGRILNELENHAMRELKTSGSCTLDF